MQSLTVLFISWFVIVIRCSASDLDVSFLDQNSLGFLDDSSISFNLLDDSSIQGTNSLAQLTDSNVDWFFDSGDQFGKTDWFLDDDDQPSEISGLDSGFFLAEVINCDVNNADDTQLFDKRGTVCKNPSGVKDPPPEEIINPTDPFNTDELLNIEPTIFSFQQSSEVCPTLIFGTSKIPVCSKDKNARIRLDLVFSATLYNILPGAFASGYNFSVIDFDSKKS